MNSDDNGEYENPDHTGNETSDNLSIGISKTDTGYQAEYKIPEKDSDLIQDNFIICIAQYSIEGKILNVVVRQCVNSYGAVQTKRVENTAETRAFLLSAESCKAAVICASVSEE